VRSLGADDVIDYTREKLGDRRWDVIIDTAGRRSFAELRRALAPAGALAIVGGEGGNAWTGGFFERMIGAGDLLLESAGEHGQSRFSDIRDPEAVQLEIYRQMEANDRRRAGYATTQPHRAVADRTPTPPTRSPTPLDDLERLADLRDRGAVTEEEFQRMKRELLDRM